MEMEQAIGMFMVGPVGPMELVIIGIIAALVFGGKRLGDLGKGLGEGIRNFRSAVSAKEEKAVEGDNSTKPSS